MGQKLRSRCQAEAELSNEPLSNPEVTLTLVRGLMVGHEYH